VEIGDERRLLILLLSGSLVRLSEAAGLLQDDIVMKGDMMTVCIRANTLRNLKTRSSERQIPLVGLPRYAVEVLL
jgi:integrase